MSRLRRALRDSSQRGSLVNAIVTDVLGGYASVRIAGLGAKYTSLEVIGGPVTIGQQVQIKYSAGTPYVLAPVVLPEYPSVSITRSRSGFGASSSSIFLPDQARQPIYLEGTSP